MRCFEELIVVLHEKSQRYRQEHRDAYARGQEGQMPPSALIHGAGGARIALNTEFFPSLLLSEGAFSVIVDSLVEETFVGSPRTPTFSFHY